MLVDLDHFKRVNDTHGHMAGDAVLREVADVLTSNVRSVDLVGRYGGEEFMIRRCPRPTRTLRGLAPRSSAGSSGSRQVRIEDGHVLAVTLSAGVAGGPGQFLQLDSAGPRSRTPRCTRPSPSGATRSTSSTSSRRAASSVAPRSDRRPASGPSRSAARRWARRRPPSRTPCSPDRRGPVAPSTMIAEMAVSLARALDLPNGEVERVRTASLLHDLGKLAIPDEILTNPGELTDPEWRVVSEHPKIGQVVLEQAGALRDAATIVLHHHEWYDGRGYPHGLSGQEIPVGARIVAIADAYEAMVAGRPYRGAISHDKAIAELRRHAGVQFDPDLVRLFSVLFAEGVPWQPDEHDFTQSDPTSADSRTHAQIHDDLHARRRMATPGAPLDQPAVTNATGRQRRLRRPDRDDGLTRGGASRPVPPPRRSARPPHARPGRVRADAPGSAAARAASPRCRGALRSDRVGRWLRPSLDGCRVRRGAHGATDRSVGRRCTGLGPPPWRSGRGRLRADRREAGADGRRFGPARGRHVPLRPVLNDPITRRPGSAARPSPTLRDTVVPCPISRPGSAPGRTGASDSIGRPPTSPPRWPTSSRSTRPSRPRSCRWRRGSRTSAPADYRRLDADRSAVRIPAMRSSGHLVPTATLARIAAATRRPAASFDWIWRGVGLTEPEYRAAGAAIVAAAATPVTVAELRTRLPTAAASLLDRHPQAATMLVRSLRAEGALVALAPSSLRSNAFAYVAVEAWLGGPLEPVDPDDALAWLAGEYLRAFGPPGSPTSGGGRVRPPSGPRRPSVVTRPSISGPDCCSRSRTATPSPRPPRSTPTRWPSCPSGTCTRWATRLMAATGSFDPKTAPAPTTAAATATGWS